MLGGSSYTLTINTPNYGSHPYSNGAFNATLVGESGSQIFALDATVHNSVGSSSQILCTDTDIGNLLQLQIVALTTDDWVLDSVSLDGCDLPLQALAIALQDKNGTCLASDYAD